MIVRKYIKAVLLLFNFLISDVAELCIYNIEFTFHSCMAEYESTCLLLCSVWETNLTCPV